MTTEKVKERTEFLLDFLDLPKKWVLIMNLSGGQQRFVCLIDMIGVLQQRNYYLKVTGCLSVR